MQNFVGFYRKYFSCWKKSSLWLCFGFWPGDAELVLWLKDLQSHNISAVHMCSVLPKYQNMQSTRVLGSKNFFCTNLVQKIDLPNCNSRKPYFPFYKYSVYPKSRGKSNEHLKYYIYNKSLSWSLGPNN